MPQPKSLGWTFLRFLHCCSHMKWKTWKTGQPVFPPILFTHETTTNGREIKKASAAAPYNRYFNLLSPDRSSWAMWPPTKKIQFCSQEDKRRNTWSPQHYLWNILCLWAGKGTVFRLRWKSKEDHKMFLKIDVRGKNIRIINFLLNRSSQETDFNF